MYGYSGSVPIFFWSPVYVPCGLAVPFEILYYKKNSFMSIHVFTWKHFTFPSFAFPIPPFHV